MITLDDVVERVARRLYEMNATAWYGERYRISAVRGREPVTPPLGDWDDPEAAVRDQKDRWLGQARAVLGEVSSWSDVAPAAGESA